MRAARVFGFWCAGGARFVHEAARVVRERRRAMRRGEARVIEFRSTMSAAVRFLALRLLCDVREQLKVAASEQAITGALWHGSVLPEMQYARFAERSKE